MLLKRIVFVLGFILHSSGVLALSSCTQNADCSSLEGSICLEGDCVCPAGQQPVLGGTQCTPIAPYFLSPCIEDHQCSNLITGFECRRSNVTDVEGLCFCRSGFHYLRGRCWRQIDFGEPCNRDEECLGVIQDPFALSCNGTCGCSEGYYLRQRGECRKIGYAVGEGCVINEDCQFENGACNITTLTCYNITTAEEESEEDTEDTVTTISPEEDRTPERLEQRTGEETSIPQDGVPCNTTSDCLGQFVCSAFGSCVCPAGYYARSDGRLCLAHLGSPASEAQCVGILSEVRNGLCTCRANFFFEENMIDCIRATRRLNESCVIDTNCHTFGVNSRCGPPQDPWFLRSCECNPELTVWDSNRDLCRLFAGIGEFCEEDSDCMAGNMEIQCVQNEFGVGQCECPAGYTVYDGLCLTTGLQLGDMCQATQECTGTNRTVCSDGRCSCEEGYQAIDDFCAPTIGGACSIDEDCTIENTICLTENNSSSCRCQENFVTYGEYCWPSVSGHNAFCNVTVQCQAAIRGSSECVENHCTCTDSTHFRDGGCWNRIGLFETCTRTGECYLQDISDRVVCRNSLCQCSFDYPYLETEHTCRSGASAIFGHLFLIALAVHVLYNI